ncbi:putative FBD domain-containing protein [Medicago truncatula]|uniref:Putative FBD domain-containing protein n=1 Tax=Medicago truncatula TaxID=3880 RepID=A0A396J435_MEDTR|nr:putative FBD-associated F-box protein At3g50710 [Medicago truncatula]RHN71558.1 putative FBD domain-containing protein [Medicago truncatula]
MCRYFPLKALSTSNFLCLDTFLLYTQARDVYQVSQPQSPYENIPIFHNLTYLELHNSWHLILQVLHHCPKLQNLKIYEESYAAMGIEDNQENWVDPEFVPQCFLSHLRTYTILNNAGPQSQLMLGKYILKNANSLQTMTISSESEKRKLSECPKASATCQLLVNGII